MTMREIDLLIEARWIIPIEPAGVAFENHAIAIDAGRIVGLLPRERALDQYHPRSRVNLANHVLLPGLINLHAHAAMTLLRGRPDGDKRKDWLYPNIWPAEAWQVSAGFVRDGTLLACAEMLRGGITCFNDMYFHPEASAEAALRLGMRACLGILAAEAPSAYAADADDYLSKGLAARDALRDEPLISFCMAPQAPHAVADKNLERIATLAAQLDLPSHTHLHETRTEIDDSIRQHGVRPIERLRRLGLLGPGLIAAHAIHLEPNEIALLAEEGCHVAHCPTANMRLATGIAPVAGLMQRGVQPGLGTDATVGSGRLDMFREINHASLLANLASGNAAAIDSHAVLRMATLNGAVALGLDQQIGSLVTGKQADICAIRLEDPASALCRDPANQLVHGVGREQVSHVWICGNALVIDGKLPEIDALELLDIANLWHNVLKY